MYTPADYYRSNEEVSDEDDVFIEETDIVEEIPIDEEELPEVDEEASDPEAYDEADDSIHTFRHTGEVYTIACSPVDPSLVATGDGDDKGFLWGIGQGDWVFGLKDHSNTVSSVRFSTDGKLLASGSFDGVVKVWDVASKTLKRNLQGLEKGIEWVRWHPRDHLVLAGSDDFNVWMWDVDEDDDFCQVFRGHRGIVRCGDITLDGKTVCTGSADATMRIWDLEKKETVHVIRGHHHYHTEELTCLATSADSALALTGSTDASAYVVNIVTGKVVVSLEDHSDSVECVGFSPSSPLAATGGMDGKLIIWDIQHSAAPRCTCVHEEGVTCLLWLGSSHFVATGSVMGNYEYGTVFLGNV